MLKSRAATTTRSNLQPTTNNQQPTPRPQPQPQPHYNHNHNHNIPQPQQPQQPQSQPQVQVQIKDKVSTNVGTITSTSTTRNSDTGAKCSSRATVSWQVWPNSTTTTETTATQNVAPAKSMPSIKSETNTQPRHIIEWASALVPPTPPYLGVL